MSAEPIKQTTVYGLLILLISLAICDVWLLVRVRAQTDRLTFLEAENETISHAPSPGQLVPLVQGLSVPTQRPEAIKLAASPRLFLLVFSKSCKYCLDNWNQWRDLFSRHSAVPVYLITSDRDLPGSFLKDYPLVLQRPTLFAVDPEVLTAFNVASTPQTIYVVDGHVKHDWVGLLSHRDMKDIEQLRDARSQ